MATAEERNAEDERKYALRQLDTLAKEVERVRAKLIGDKLHLIDTMYGELTQAAVRADLALARLVTCSEGTK